MQKDVHTKYGENACTLLMSLCTAEYDSPAHITEGVSEPVYSQVGRVSI